MRRFVMCVVGVVAFAVPVAGQEDVLTAVVSQQQAQEKPGSTPPPEKQETPKPSAEPSTRVGQLANVRLEVTITDQRASGQPTTKTVSLTLADRANGRIRTSGDIRTPQGYRPITLNVDAHPEFTRDGRVRAQITLEYRPAVGEATTEEQAMTAISETFAVILDDGKALVVSQSADPYTDRRVRVEVKATILK